MRVFSMLLFGILIIGCRKKDPPKPPSSAQLVFPEQNSECTTGQNINVTASRVEFRWSASDNTDSYQLRVTNLNTSVTQTISTTNLRATLPLEKGTPFSWLVLSRNDEVTQTASSSSWLFYNAGSQTTYAPFPAEIIAPKLAASVFKDINNEVTLEWTGADVEDDIMGYDLYFSTETPPNTIVALPSTGDTSQKVSVSSDTMYYWKVITKDSQGNTSDSGIFEFKVL